VVAEDQGRCETVSCQQLEKSANRLRGADVAAKHDLGKSLAGDIVEHEPQIALVLLWLVIVAHFVSGERATHHHFLP
jgi:hypothetical protein